MTDLNRPTEAQQIALRQRLVTQKREAVYQAAKRYYTCVCRGEYDGEVHEAKRREHWRWVAYNVADWVLAERDAQS